MTKFCTLTIDRGDRPALLDFCKKQIAKQTIVPEMSFFITEPPADERKDIVPRMMQGLLKAEQAGFDKVIILESDDFYPPDYCEFVLDGWKKSSRPCFIGCSKTLYYNLVNNTWQLLEHEFRSSLFTTAFNISALKDFRWPDPTTAMLDIPLWKYANKSSVSVLYNDPQAIGIKHNIGLTGGKAHRMTLRNHDPERTWLKKAVNKEAFEFYQSLIP